MPTISGRVAAAANAVTPNVLAGSPFEFITAASIVKLACTQAGAAPTDITCNFQIGGEAIVNGGNVSDRAAFPTFLDDAFALAGGAFALGILLFSGSLYGLALSGVGALGLITPFGGLAFLGGWLCLGLLAWRIT